MLGVNVAVAVPMAFLPSNGVKIFSPFPAWRSAPAPSPCLGLALCGCGMNFRPVHQKRL
jgi:hypothetical protein